MAKLIECIPNFSEGRDREVIDALVETARGVGGAALLDHSADPSHNRCVITIAGDPDGVAEAAFRLARTACERIDLTKHAGQHPRIGAVDVIPFVPVKDCGIPECVEVSKRVGKRIADELGIPVFLYERSASSPARQNLANIRRGQFEGMPAKLLLEEWGPDYGGRRVHPTAGAVAVGARMPLVAFNINLSTPDVNIAKAIAKSVRGSSGGYRYCKAIGVRLEERNIAQVSMNMVDCEGTPLYRVFEAVRAEAERFGARIIGSEIIGLAPAKALVDSAEYYLKLENFDYGRQVLENRLNFGNDLTE